MSVSPDQMPGLPGMNQPADPNLQQFQDLSGQAAGVEEAAAQNTAQTAQQLQGMQPPQRQTGIFSQAPYLIALAALGGKAIGLHARTMLGATNGMVKGMLMGNQQAYDDALKQYQENRQKLLDTYDLQQSYYKTLYAAYGDRADAKLKAIQAARQLTNDEWTHQYKDQLAAQKQGLDEQKAYIQQERFIETLREDHMKDLDRQIREGQNQQRIAQHQQQIEQKLSTLKGPDGLKQLDGMIRTLNTQAAALRQKSITGYEGLNEQDKAQYDQLLQDMARLNVRKQEMMQQQTAQPAPAGGSPSEPRTTSTGIDAATGAPASSGFIDRGKGDERVSQPAVAPQSGGAPHPGWTLMTDKNGVQAWVSPDKTQFEPVGGGG